MTAARPDVGAPRRRLGEQPFVRFLVTGAANTAVGFVIFRVLLQLLGNGRGRAGLAQAMAYAIGIAASYVANRGWAFRSDGAHRHELPRFVAAHVGGLALSTALLQLAVTRLAAPVTVCWVGVTGIMTLVNFTVQRYWVFAPR